VEGGGGGGWIVRCAHDGKVEAEQHVAPSWRRAIYAAAGALCAHAHLARAIDELQGVRRRRIGADERVDVLCESALLEEGGEGVAPRVGALHLEHFNLVVLQVVVEHKWAQLAIDAAAVIPRKEEAQHLRSAHKKGRRKKGGVKG